MLLLVILAAITWVYVIEALKRAPRVSWLHGRTDTRARVLSWLGAIVIGLCAGDLVMGWLALVVQWVIYDGVVRRARHGLA